MPVIIPCTLPSCIQHLEHTWLIVNNNLFAIRVFNGRVVCLSQGFKFALLNSIRCLPLSKTNKKRVMLENEKPKQAQHVPTK